MSLETNVDDLVNAIGDGERYAEALRGIAQTAPTARRDEIDAVLPRLIPVLDQIPFGLGANLAQMAASMAGESTDPTVVVPTLVRRATEAMEMAEVFAGAYGDLPDPEDEEQIEPTIERFATDAETYLLVQAWFAGGQWVQAVLYLSQRKEVRAAIPERARLIAATETMRERFDTAHWLYGLLLVLDDEPLIVLHRATGRGYWVTISGIGDNFQLHTLLAGALIGDESQGLLPGERPSAAELAAASEGEELTPAGGIRGNFNLVDAYGEWIWNEGRPADIPLLEGRRVVVVDPPPYQRTWNAGRLYPLMRPTLTVDGVLPPAEAQRWLGLVKPSQRT